jgi:hypothetical protein
MSWNSQFREPIELPDGVRLASLREAIVHLVNTVPSFERGIPVVLTAAELITSAAERGDPIEFARIATLRALNRHAERVLNPDILKSRISMSFRERQRPNILDPLLSADFSTPATDSGSQAFPAQGIDNLHLSAEVASMRDDQNREPRGR